MSYDRFINQFAEYMKKTCDFTDADETMALLISSLNQCGLMDTYNEYDRMKAAATGTGAAGGSVVTTTTVGKKSAASGGCPLRAKSDAKDTNTCTDGNLDIEMDVSSPDVGSKASGSGKKLTGWLLFAHNKRAEFKKANKSASLKEISAEWKKLTKEEKKNYS